METLRISRDTATTGAALFTVATVPPWVIGGFITRNNPGGYEGFTLPWDSLSEALAEWSIGWFYGALVLLLVSGPYTD